MKTTKYCSQRINGPTCIFYRPRVRLVEKIKLFITNKSQAVHICLGDMHRKTFRRYDSLGLQEEQTKALLTHLLADTSGNIMYGQMNIHFNRSTQLVMEFQHIEFFPSIYIENYYCIVVLLNLLYSLINLPGRNSDINFAL